MLCGADASVIHTGNKHMGWISVICASIGAWLFYQSQNDWLFWFTIGAGVLAFWSYGVMHNYAIEVAKKRQGFNGRFYDIAPHEADAVPNWIAMINMLSSIICFVLFGVAIFVS